MILYFYFIVMFWSGAVAWSVEFLPSNPAVRVRFPAGSRILIYILELCVSFVYVLSCVVCDSGPDIQLTTDSGRPALVYLSSVLVYSLCFPYRHLTHGHLGCKSWGCKALHCGRVNKKEIKSKKVYLFSFRSHVTFKLN